MSQMEELATVAEISAAKKIAKSTIYLWIAEGFIPHIKVRGCVRFRPAEVEDWLRKHTRPGRAQRVPLVEVEV